MEEGQYSLSSQQWPDVIEHFSLRSEYQWLIMDPDKCDLMLVPAQPLKHQKLEKE